ncbi:MAG: hypothetical protein ABW250_17150 [Pyrinomonadaceae bacterium]
MFARHRAPARAVLLALLTLAPAASPAQQPEPQRRPQGPVAGPAIKLPRGAGAEDSRTRDAGARPDEEAERAAWSPQKWEYCVIKGFRYNQKGLSASSRTPAAFVRYFPNGSEEIEGATEDEALGNAFAKLGDEGWELTAVRTDFSLSDGNGTAAAAYFFKRPKRQE